jgi:hypothetical protein
MPYFSNHYRTSANLGAALVLLFILFLMALMTSCTTAKKATHYFNNHLEVGAKWCAEVFPVAEVDSNSTTTFDSTAYIVSLKELQEWVNHLNNINDSLLYELIDKDTTCSKYAPIIRYLRAQNDKLNDKLGNIKPIVKYEYKEKKVLDSALMRARGAAAARRIEVLEGQITEKDKQIAVLSSKLKEAKEAVKEKATELWLHRLLIVVLLLWIFRKPIINLLVPVKKYIPFLK